MTEAHEPTSERVARLAEELESGLRELLLDHSQLTKRPPPPPGVVILAPNYRWGKLDDEGRRLGADLARRHAQFSDLVVALLHPSEKTGKELSKAAKTVAEVIEQSSGSYYATTQRAFDDARGSIESRVKLVQELYDPTPGEIVFVPDANAIVYNHHLDEWEFEDAARFTLVLTSTLLSELDDLKMRHRNERVREAAESAIRQIKDLMGRGDVHGAGVTLRRDRSMVRMTAPEPDFGKTLSWLDATSMDDRLLASVLEVVREHPHSPVVLVTRDVGMQNKARHAGVPVVEPPEPAERPTPKKKPTDVRIVKFTGGEGSEQFVSFRVRVQNYEQRPVQATVSATIEGEPVQVHPEELNLLANAAPTVVSVHVPRPARGDLVKPFNDETTLYGGTLEVIVAVDDVPVASQTWSEIVYSREDNHQRWELQQRIWRVGRGEATEADHRAEGVREMLERHESRYE